MTYRVLDPGFTMHACDAARDSTCMHGRMSWPAVLKELLAAKYARVAPRCQTVCPSAGHKPLCVSNGHHVRSAKPSVHQKCPDSNRRYWAVSNYALWQFTRIKTPQNLVYLLIFVLINKIGMPHQNCSMSLLTYFWGTLFISVKLKHNFIVINQLFNLTHSSSTVLRSV